MRGGWAWLTLAAFVALAALAGCGLKPIAYPVPQSELGNEPGLFTGPSGEAVLYRR